MSELDPIPGSYRAEVLRVLSRHDALIAQLNREPFLVRLRLWRRIRALRQHRDHLAALADVLDLSDTKREWDAIRTRARQ